MYSEFYGFNTKPFHITPDPDFLFMSPKHREALTCMEFGLVEKVGLTLISGEIGIGKTTLIQHLLQSLGSDVCAACLTNTNVTPEQLLALIAHAFGAEEKVSGKSDAVQLVQWQLEQINTAGRSPLLIIDDAQNLSFDALDEVRWISNLQNKNGLLVQIILVGQPELRAKLQHPAMTSLTQRIGIGYHLRPFTKEETQDYIVHRIATAGGPENLFTEAAIDLIYTTTQGIPRTINLLCDNALVYGFAEEHETIDIPSVQQAIEEIGGYGVGYGVAAPEASDPAQAFSNSQEASQQGIQYQLDASESEIEKRLQNLESRVELLDRVFGLSTKRLLATIKNQMDQERGAKEKLLVELTRLQERIRSSKKKGAAAAAPLASKKNSGQYFNLPQDYKSRWALEPRRRG